MRAVAFSFDGALLATASADETARVFATDTGTEVLRVAHDGAVGAVTFSSDEKWIATGCDDGTARVLASPTA